MFRMESVPNALEQAKQAACAIMGRPRPAGECPWQWSDQFDLKLQIAGYAFDADSVILRGDPATAKFAIFHLKGDQVQSVEAINSPPEFMMGKLLRIRDVLETIKITDVYFEDGTIRDTIRIKEMKKRGSVSPPWTMVPWGGGPWAIFFRWRFGLRNVERAKEMGAVVCPSA
jgi:hypothetical protein